MNGQRAYCDRPHPGGDAEADAWCEQYHRVTMPRTRSSIPTQLREAGHTVDASTGADRRIVYTVNGEAMGLVDAADRYLPGGWAASFGRGA